jgi:hypothetical protein
MIPSVLYYPPTETFPFSDFCLKMDDGNLYFYQISYSKDAKRLSGISAFWRSLEKLGVEEDFVKKKLKISYFVIQKQSLANEKFRLEFEKIEVTEPKIPENANDEAVWKTYLKKKEAYSRKVADARIKEKEFEDALRSGRFSSFLMKIPFEC